MSEQQQQQQGEQPKYGLMVKLKWYSQALIKNDPAFFYNSMIGIHTADQGDPTNVDSRFWCNMGFWKEARTMAGAGSALAMELGKAAGLQAGDHVLDVGFGFGEQDLIWVKQFNVDRVVGINITQSHIDFAKYRVQVAGLQDRIDLKFGNATALEFGDATFTKVVALESAHHFNPRTAFFKEAFRVLKPGGVLATADIISSPAPGSKPFQTWMTGRMSGTPMANLVSIDVYARHLREAGFVDVKTESIRDHVFPGALVYYREKMTGKRADQIVTGDADEATKVESIKNWHNFNMGDYVLSSARKP